jgi:hypothetical protein
MFQNNFLMKKHPRIVLKPEVKLFGNFFAGCASLTDVDIDCTNLTTLSKSFAGCMSLIHANLHSTEHCTNCSSIFAACAELLPENIEGMNLSNVTNASGVFENCWPFTESNLIIPDGSGRTLSSYDALGLHPEIIDGYIVVKPNKFIEISDNFVNLPSATNIHGYFAYNTNLKVIPDFGNTPGVTNVSNMFIGDKNVEQGMLAAYLYFKSLGAQITNHSNCFKDCGINTPTGRAELEQIPASWGGLAEG